MEGLGFAVLVYLVRYCPLASLVPLTQNCLPGCPLEHCVLHLSDVAIPLDSGSVS